MDKFLHKIPEVALFVYAICLLSLIPKIEGADPVIECPNTNLSTTSTYAPNSTYETNLNTLFSVLSSNSTVSNGFHKFNAGSSVPDIAYGLFLCRGDVSANMCRDCVVYAIGDVVEKCPGAKQVTIWYDQCMLRYSNVSLTLSIFSAPETGSWYMWNLQNVTNVTRLNEVLEKVMTNITDRASSDHSGKKFATAKANFSSVQSVYGLAQCTPDLSDSDCNNCLRICISRFSKYCAGKVGGRVLFGSCIVRYEMYPFYNASLGAAPSPPSPVVPPPPPPPPPSTTTTSGPANRSVLEPANTEDILKEGKKGNIIKIGVSISASVVVVVVVVLLGSNIYYQRRSKRTAKEEKENSFEVQLLDLAEGRIVDDYNTENSNGENPAKSQDFPSIQLDIILVATKQFSEENKLGEGGFGPVYKGTLSDGKEIAVKRLSRNSGQGLQEFKNEISLIARLQHRNLVRLLGCCLEGNELMLIYEYMPNKSLDFFLFDSTKAAELDWKRRFLIINGIARGLLYLHEDSRLRIIHRDLKVSNILLDREMNPKISDFGMARIFGGNQSEANTNRVVGTYGYMAPEYAMEGLFSVKSDVFSFGVLLLEIISGKRNSGFYLSEHGHSLLTYAWNLWCKGEGVLNLMDPLLVDSCVETEVLKCIHLGLLCVQEDPADRPTMSTIVITLGSDSVTLPKPTQPAFSVGRLVLKSCQASPNANLVSANEMTISDVSAR
ncbi:cysteine-rich receptor-like protein kinase 15 [Rhododendron vialii]|uniref:cysteine-rich receptor-like protein kinase 15 n=1 Tax=Rhododendron vialii TaxID=182163 RepID=UPI00265F610F|nr:cysteine-rich receptor-like protein kinase 15 [Rhododendron vialii]